MEYLNMIKGEIQSPCADLPEFAQDYCLFPSDVFFDILGLYIGDYTFYLFAILSVMWVTVLPIVESAFMGIVSYDVASNPKG